MRQPLLKSEENVWARPVSVVLLTFVLCGTVAIMDHRDHQRLVALEAKVGSLGLVNVAVSEVPVGGKAKAGKAKAAAEPAVPAATPQNVEIDFSTNMPEWEWGGQKWHLNLQAVITNKKPLGNVYHVTKDGTKEHYFFQINGSDLVDPASLAGGDPSTAWGKAGTKFKYTDLPADVRIIAKRSYDEGTARTASTHN